jgi:hypothetical protein
MLLDVRGLAIAYGDAPAVWLIVGNILAANLGQGVVFAQFAAVVIAGAIAVLLLGQETKGKSLEEI